MLRSIGEATNSPNILAEPIPERMSEPLFPPVLLIAPRRIQDDRGWFSETYNARVWAKLGVSDHFIQDNQSHSREVNTLRGLHFQLPPHAQAKLVRCVRGRLLDVAVDLRAGSPTYGRWVGAVLDAEAGQQLYISAGFGHGFLTLEPDTEIAYKVSAAYAPECDSGLRWDDPALAIPWPLLDDRPPILSAKDKDLPLLTDFSSPFAYDGRPLLPLGTGLYGNVS